MKSSLIDGINTHILCDLQTFEKTTRKLVETSWQLVPAWERNFFEDGNYAIPFEFLSPILPEPLVYINEAGNQRCLSNVCTHRAHLVCPSPLSNLSELRCPYHGKRFDLQGHCKGMPNCELSKDFPSSKDHLCVCVLKKWQSFSFVSLTPAFDLIEELKSWEPLLNFIPFESLSFQQKSISWHEADCHWLLYLENFLEGLHIPFIHPSLLKTLEPSGYETICYTWSNVQVSRGKKNDLCFDLPKNHPFFGQRITAFYCYLFPNIMFNFYPWGLSLNIVYPISANKTKIQFIPFVWQSHLYNQGSGSNLNQVEKEDEAALSYVQKGIRSRFFQNARLLTQKEQGVVHLHEMIRKILAS